MKYLQLCLTLILLVLWGNSFGQSNSNSDSFHLKVKRMNDTYIDA